ncbi:hypothetical protein [Paenibacillus illinoisensis]|uniref:hypothetical protein n=1 Tax=Paenibacillus illinoisensis TaxID=59845 RepID=UPI001C8E350A|nr:hypothetical protein [Paenibacillus illinoisensis]
MQRKGLGLSKNIAWTSEGEDLSWRSEAFAFATGMFPFEKKDFNLKHSGGNSDRKPNFPGASSQSPFLTA